jgi:short-subunit dehydrogenase
MNVTGKNIWITGSSSGIGKALAIELSRYSTTLILSSRNIEELNKVADICKKNGAKTIVVPIDLQNNQSIENAVSIVFEQLKKVDILINNGGVSQRAKAIETPIEIDRKIMEINYFGTITLTKLVLRQMIQQKNGHIVAVSSISGKFGFYLRSAYAASKHALHGFFETLYFEIKKQNINVTIVMPGRVKTNVSFNALTKDGTPYNKMDAGQEQGITAEKCAKKIIKAIEKNKKEVLIGGKEILMVHLKRLFPFLFNKIVTNLKPT